MSAFKDILRPLVNRLTPYAQRLRKMKLKQFERDYVAYMELDTSPRFPVSPADFYPCLDDRTEFTNFDAHYIYHPAWAARIVREISPDLHIDISSTLYFCTMLSAFIPVRFYDYRPASVTLRGLECLHADLTHLPFADNSIASLSCMHTIEHVGLGRYGDPIAPEGDLKAITELKRVCAPDGTLLLVVPVGEKRIEFNAHRIYDPFDIVGYFNGFRLQKFSLINDSGEFLDNGDVKDAALQRYGCGCFWFIKDSYEHPESHS